MKQTLAAVAFATAALAAHAQQPIVLKVAHFWPPTAMSQQKVLEPWCAKIAKESNNQLQCQIYPAMQLGGTPAQLIQQAIDGVADVVWTLPGYTAGRFPSMEVMELPFLTKDAEGGSRAAWEIYEKYGQKDFAGVKPLAFNVHDRGHLHNNKRPITKVSDLKGLKMRAPTRLTNKMVAALGATPVGMPMPQVPDAVSKGVVDGYVLPWEVIPTMKLHEMTKYHSEINAPQPGLYTTLFTIAMNQAKYDSLPPELKKVIDANSGAEFSASIGRAWDASAPPARKQAEERGNQFNTIGAAEVEGFQKATARVTDDWIKEVTAKGYDGKAMVEDARALSAKYAERK
ncbi:TRAP transporter substrate-binding protein [Melaminivora alkalimesophila]|uniref:TRAP-type C4-dicarboxylate transport system substrate-binding protein n=1 Tax=Melaminivora alkalimesophila TaxID=1165852 RepID=A0A317RBM1_9BURK|nr:TRAP transporter substrate-binding protein [Melaminivora alkalimesophila]PWW44609.1 TRAP-type C4-dicarboxylate transport system substrate-binding protein [Melaminivora alkalimesophila]